MARLTDPERLEAYTNALSNWRFEGYIEFKLTEQCRRWIRQNLGIRVNELGRLMHEYVNGGGDIDEVRETRSEWSDKHEFHYDLRFAIEDVRVYVETRLHDHAPFKPDTPWIEVVSVHAP